MKPNLLMVYGILKKGYELDLSNYGAGYVGECYIEGATLYGIGPMGVGKFHGVGLRLDERRFKDFDKADIPPLSVGTAHGELWEIPDGLWDWLDQIEQNGFVYVRKIVTVKLQDDHDAATKDIEAYVYEHCYPGFKYEHPLKEGVF